MAWITPKTDWTATDYYNAADLNRVENNTSYIKDLLALLGYYAATTAFNMTRTRESIVYYDNINAVENNIKALKDCSYEPLGWITPVTTWVSVYSTFSYTDANRLESNLANLKEMVERIEDAMLFCGASTTICGRGSTLF
jgi:hypothetical protein